MGLPHYDFDYEDDLSHKVKFVDDRRFGGCFQHVFELPGDWLHRYYSEIYIKTCQLLRDYALTELKRLDVIPLGCQIYSYGVSQGNKFWIKVPTP